MISDREYLDRVDHLASQSKDPSTGIGAVLVLSDQTSLDSFNELPERVKDAPERRERPAKYFFTEHAERNVIYKAARLGFSTYRAILYTTGVPCADCARAVIQAGLHRVVVWKKGSGLEQLSRWADSIAAGRQMLTEAGVGIVEVER